MFRLKVETEGISSGVSLIVLPATLALTLQSRAGGVRLEDLVASITRLSAIQETVPALHHGGIAIRDISSSGSILVRVNQ